MNLHLYRVHFSVPGRHGYRHNRTLNVAAKDVIRAAEIVRECEDEATVYQVVHLGKIDLLGA